MTAPPALVRRLAAPNGSFTETCGCRVGSPAHVPGPATAGARAEAALHLPDRPYRSDIVQVGSATS